MEHRLTPRSKAALVRRLTLGEAAAVGLPLLLQLLIDPGIVGFPLGLCHRIHSFREPHPRTQAIIIRLKPTRIISASTR